MDSPLLWFSGITWHTPLNQIGWTYIVVGALGMYAGILIKRIFKP